MSEELKTLFPGEQIVIEGETITVKPFTFGQLPKVLGLFQKLEEEFVKLQGQGKNLTTSAVVGLLAAGGSDIMEVMAGSSGLSVQTVSNLSMDDGVNLLATVIKANQSFFVERMPAALKKMQEKQLAGHQ